MERVSPILDARGNPIRVKELTKEIARPSMTGVRQVWHTDSVAGWLTPDRLAAMLQDAAEGHAYEYLTLAEEMEERDPHYGSVLGTRKRAITGIEPTVESASDDPADVKLADALREVIRDDSFGDLVDDAVDGLGKGYSVCEIMWDRSSMWTPERYIWRDPRYFKFDMNDGMTLRLIDEANSFNGIALEPYKFVVHIPKLKSGIPIRGGLARLAAATYMCKQYSVTDWMAFAEIFGMPMRIGKYDTNATQDDILTLVNAVANIGSDAAAVIPKSMEIAFENGRTGSSADLFEKLATYLDKQISKAVLGQTMTADDGSSQAQANVHNDVRLDILESDLKQLEKTINRDLVKPFIDLNFGVQKRYPKVKFFLQDEDDIGTMVDALAKLVPLGLRVEQSVVRDRLGIPDVPKDAEVLSPPGVQTGQAMNHECSCSACQAKALNRAAPQPDALDDLTDEAMQDWEPMMKGVVDPLQQLADESEDYDQFLAALPGIADQMSPEEFITKLAEQAFKARGLGDAKDSV